MKFSIEVDAVQWNKDGDHPAVRTNTPELYRKRDSGYVRNLFPLAKFWMSIDPIMGEPSPEDFKKADDWLGPHLVQFDDKKYWRRIWMFNIWSISGEHTTTPLEPDDAFLRDYIVASIKLFGNEYSNVSFYGTLRTPAIDGRVVVFPGDWIVQQPKGLLIMSNEDFQKRLAGA